jgi:hypothetical protein
MLGVGLEPTIPEFEWAKTVHASDHAATLIGTPDFTVAEWHLGLIASLLDFCGNSHEYYIEWQKLNVCLFIINITPWIQKKNVLPIFHGLFVIYRAGLQLWWPLGNQNVEIHINNNIFTLLHYISEFFCRRNTKAESGILCSTMISSYWVQWYARGDRVVTQHGYHTERTKNHLHAPD